MNKNRYLLCLLVCGLLLYYAVPNLSVQSEGAQGIFSISWLLLALFVVAGNLSAFLYTPKKAKGNKKFQSGKGKRKIRSLS